MSNYFDHLLTITTRHSVNSIHSLSAFMAVCLFTSFARATAKYHDEYVCVSVCTRGYLRRRTRDLYQLCMLLVAVARSFSGTVTKSQGKGQFCGFSSPVTTHCNAFAAKRIIPYRPVRGWWECTAGAKCDLRLHCFLFLVRCETRCLQ